MYPEPEYAQKIVVGVIFRNSFAWYVTEYEYWYLDYTKFDRALIAGGYKNSTLGDYSNRWDIGILNEDTAECFLSHIETYRVPAYALTEMMLIQRQMYEEYASVDSPEYFNDILDFAPCLLVDFDQRRLSSQYPEMIRFETWIPDGWDGAYRSFLSDVPEAEQYWIVDGRDLFKNQ